MKSTMKRRQAKKIMKAWDSHEDPRWAHNYGHWLRARHALQVHPFSRSLRPSSQCLVPTEQMRPLAGTDYTQDYISQCSTAVSTYVVCFKDMSCRGIRSLAQLLSVAIPPHCTRRILLREMVRVSVGSRTRQQTAPALA